MKRWSVWIGFLLIAMAAAGLIFWEMRGRELILMEEVTVAAAEIPAGSPLKRELVQTLLVPKGSRVEGALRTADLRSFYGEKTGQRILKNQQLSRRDFERPESALTEGTSFFVLEGDWIAMRSSALRRGDIVEILSADGTENFGRYPIGFVKDPEETEVQDLSLTGELLLQDTEAAERIMGTGRIDHVEIVTDSDAWFAIRKYAESREEPSLVLVLRQEKEAER